MKKVIQFQGTKYDLKKVKFEELWDFGDECVEFYSADFIPRKEKSK